MNYYYFVHIHCFSGMHSLLTLSQHLLHTPFLLPSAGSELLLSAFAQVVTPPHDDKVDGMTKQVVSGVSFPNTPGQTTALPVCTSFSWSNGSFPTFSSQAANLRTNPFPKLLQEKRSQTGTTLTSLPNPVTCCRGNILS